jgi:hypothetical protein
LKRFVLISLLFVSTPAFAGDEIAKTVAARRARKARRSAIIAARDRADAIQAARDEVARKAMLKESLEVGRVQAQIGLAQGAQMQAMASSQQAAAMAMQAQAMREQADATRSLGRRYPY